MSLGTECDKKTKIPMKKNKHGQFQQMY